MHGILCVNPADPFQFHGLRRQHQEQVGCSLIVPSYTWPKGSEMSQMGMRRTRRSKRARTLVMCSFMMCLDLSTSRIFRFNPQTVQPLWSANVLCTFSPPKAWTGRPGTWSSWAMFANPLDVFTKQHKVSLIHQFGGMISTSLYRRSRIKH